MTALAKAAAKYYSGDTLWGNAFADLAVTGRSAYSFFSVEPPSENDIKSAVVTAQLLAGTLDESKLTAAVRTALNRAYQVVWALRNPNPDVAYRFRPQLGWIAVNAENDSPARPVNVPGGIPVLGAGGKQVSVYPQYELTVAVCSNSTQPPYAPHQCAPGTPNSIPVQIRYTVAGLPEISDLSPSNIPPGKAGKVTITGANFVGIQSVSPVNNFSFTVDSPTQITVDVPNNLPVGVYPIQVSSGAGYSSGTVNLFVTPVIRGISPKRGPRTGGTLVQIWIDGFSTAWGNDLQLSIGQVKATAHCGYGICYLGTPPHSGSSTVDIIATVSGISSLPSAADQFTYTEYPELAAFKVPDPSWEDQSAGAVSLNGVAPPGGAVITLTSSKPDIVAIPATVTIPECTECDPTVASVPLRFLPTRTAEPVTLTAKYQNTSASATLTSAAWPPISIVLDRIDSAHANVTVTINTLAPTGDANIGLTASDPTLISLPVAANVTIPAGSYKTTFPVTGHFSVSIVNGKPVIHPKQAKISATYNGATASVYTVVPFPPTKGPKNCPKGYYWSEEDSQCEAFPPM